MSGLIDRLVGGDGHACLFRVGRRRRDGIAVTGWAGMASIGGAWAIWPFGRIEIHDDTHAWIARACRFSRHFVQSRNDAEACGSSPRLGVCVCFIVGADGHPPINIFMVPVSVPRACYAAPAGPAPRRSVEGGPLLAAVVSRNSNRSATDNTHTLPYITDSEGPAPKPGGPQPKAKPSPDPRQAIQRKSHEHGWAELYGARVVGRLQHGGQRPQTAGGGAAAPHVDGRARGHLLRVVPRADLAAAALRLPHVLRHRCVWGKRGRGGVGLWACGWLVGWLVGWVDPRSLGVVVC